MGRNFVVSERPIALLKSLFASILKQQNLVLAKNCLANLNTCERDSEEILF